MNLVERINDLSVEQRQQIIDKTNEDIEGVIRKANGGEK